MHSKILTTLHFTLPLTVVFYLISLIWCVCVLRLRDHIDDTNNLPILIFPEGMSRCWFLYHFVTAAPLFSQSVVFGTLCALCSTVLSFDLPSMLWRCWLGSRKGIRLVKKLSDGVLAWLSVLSKVQTSIWPSWCQCHSPSLASVKFRIGFTFLVPAHPGGPGQRAV